MEKVDAIKDLCSDLIFYPVIFNQDIATHLMVSAGLIENDITKSGCDDWFNRGMIETARYIRENVASCSDRTLDDVYFLLLQMSGTVH